MSTEQQFAVMKDELNERQWRLFLGTQARQRGYGGINKVILLSGATWKTVKRGMIELESAERLPKGKVREDGGGRKKLTETDLSLVADLEKVVDTKGDPMTFVKYTTKSLANITGELNGQNHQIKKSAVDNLLHKLGYSLKPNKKNIEGKSHIDRDAQFQHINSKCALFESNNNPILSIDCKKKEPIGNFKNNGKEWIKKGPKGKETKNETQVNAYDFRSLAEGVAAPYGIYDRLKKQGFVNVGIDHDTAMFAVESIRRWWQEYGRKLYSKSTGILITADGGGSNGVRNRLFKRELQRFVNEINIPITLCHYPPATSKWNVIEHQLFSFISINWRAKPLTSLAVILELISHTTTKSGLTVKAVADTNSYQIGIKVTDKEMNELNIQRDDFHGEWNYTICPQQKVTP
jgi:hypothetical protein